MREEFKNYDLWSKRFLPHYNAGLKYQIITYRLADSLPQSILKKIQDKHMPGAPHSDAGEMDKFREAKRRKKIENLLDQNLGSCLLQYPDIAQKVIDAWRFHHEQRYELIAYVVMPNHVHILIKTLTQYKLGQIVWSWKKYVSNYVFKNQLYVELLNKYSSKAQHAELIDRKPKSKKSFIRPASECGAPSITLWQREYWDRFIRDENHFLNALQYIHLNPVKAGLVNTPEEWRFSSAFQSSG